MSTGRQAPLRVREVSGRQLITACSFTHCPSGALELLASLAQVRWTAGTSNLCKMSVAGPSSINIRPAVPHDLPSIHAIYGENVLNGTGTFAEEPPSLEEMEQTLRNVQGSKWPFLVAEISNTSSHNGLSNEVGVSSSGEIVGYGYVAQFRPRSAYRFCCEDSIYISPAARGQGVGASLMERLIDEAKQAGFLSILAIIGDSKNEGSIRLHRRFGFRDIGVMKEVGFKFGRWLDVYMMQLDVEGAEEKKAALAKASS